MSLRNILNQVKSEGFGLYDIRCQIENALKDKGIEVIGAGCGDGVADISIVIDGQEYWLDIKSINH